MKHLRKAINLFSQKYNPSYHRRQLRELEDALAELTNHGSLDEDDLTPEEFIEELYKSVLFHEDKAQLI